MADIPLDLFQRIAERANDPMRRTYMAGANANATPLDMGQLMAGFQKHAPPQAQGLLGALGKMQGLFGSKMPGFTMMGPGGMMSMGDTPSGPQPLPPAPSVDALAAAEKAIGRPLPDDVQQLYAIGDGGFGPGQGLMSLSELVDRYREMTGEPYGPLDQDWPKNLLPLFDENPVMSCIDMDSGEMVAWDPEEIEDEDSDEDWQRSFKVEHPSLAALMAEWLGKRTAEEQLQEGMRSAAAKMKARGPSPVTGYPMQLDPAEQAESEISFLSYADPSVRADFGLPETGWEDEVRRRHGLL
jgi:SMI1/KNR4 family protein SUKH-1